MNKHFFVDVHALSPLIFQEQGGDANTQYSLSYAPGSVLLGVAAREWLARHPEVSDAAIDPTFRRYFLDGNVQFLNAYPVVGGKRTLPTPTSWKRDKADSNSTADLSREPGREFRDEKQWVPASGEFTNWNGQKAALITVPRVEQMHHQRDRARGKPTTTGGAIYFKSALPAGIVLRGAVAADLPDEDVEILRDLLSGERRLGSGRGARYGRAALKVGPPRRGAPVEASLGDDVNAGEDVLSATLLSDYWPSDPCRPPLDALIREMHASIPELERAELIDAFTAVRHNRHYISAWNANTDTGACIAAGSVLVFERPDDWDDAVSGVKHAVFGAERGRGYGRVAFDWQSGTEAFGVSTQTSTLDRAPISEAIVPQSAARRMLLKQWLGEALSAIAEDVRLATGDRWPNPGALADLRSWVRRDLTLGATEQDAASAVDQLGNENAVSLNKSIAIGTKADALPALLVSALKDLQSETPDRWLGEVTAKAKSPISRPDFLKEAQLGKRDAHRLTVDFFDRLLNRMRRHAIQGVEQ